MQNQMNAFWKIVGPTWCKQKKYIFIDKADKLDAEDSAMHDNTYCIINLDNSGSMGPGNGISER